MSYAICRIQKCGSSHDIAGIQIHDRRERQHSNSNPDIDFNRSKDNYSLCDNSKGSSFNDYINKQIKARYTGKKAIRKDAVRMVQALFTSDSDFFAGKSPDEQREYFQSCLDWAKERWGAENIISADVHLDEKTPHMHLNFVPLTSDGRLSAKDCIGNGSRALQRLQDDFFKAVGRAFGLERGSRADLDNGEKPRKNQRTEEHKKSTNYYEQQRNALQATVQALQEDLEHYRIIKHIAEENAVQATPAPLSGKFGSEKKFIVTESQMSELNQQKKTAAVLIAENEKLRADNEQHSSELSLKASSLSERECLAAEKEKKAQRLLYNAEEANREAEYKLKQAEQRFQEMQKEPYVAMLQKRIKELDAASDKLADEWNEEHQKYEKVKKALNTAEKEIIPLKQQNNELSERIRVLENDLNLKTNSINQKDEEIQNLIKQNKISNELYDKAFEVGDYIASKVGLDFDEILSKRIDGYRLSYIIDEGHNRGAR